MKGVKMYHPPIEEGPLKTFSQCGEFYDKDKYLEELLLKPCEEEREEDE